MKRGIQIYVVLLGVIFLLLGLGAITDPQSIMNMVNEKLHNISSISSARAMYGGVHLMLGLFILLLGLRWKIQLALSLVIMYSGGTVIGRLVGVLTDGVNAFVIQWTLIQSTIVILSLLIIYLARKKKIDTTSGIFDKHQENTRSIV